VILQGFGTGEADNIRKVARKPSEHPITQTFHDQIDCPVDRLSDLGEIDMSTTTVDLGEHCQGAISLCCPQCRGDRLHHGRVTVFHRIEDDEMITQTVVTGPSATVEAVPNARTTNPSSRRDSIEIEFQCELCHWQKNSDLANRQMFLRIAEQKGKSLLEWCFEGRGEYALVGLPG
jgi:hypothetical protein